VQILFAAYVVAQAPAAFPQPSQPTPEEIYYEELKKEYITQPTPEASFQLELKLMKDGMYCYDLPLFDPTWRQKGKRILTSPLFAKTASSYQSPFKVYIEDSYAIIYFSSIPLFSGIDETPQSRLTGEIGGLDSRTLGPVFLYKEKKGTGQTDGWIIDRTAVADKVLYEHNGAWVVLGGDYPYFNLLQKVYSLQEIPMEEKGLRVYRPQNGKQ